MTEKRKLIGAGGAWRVFGERADSSVVKQLNSLSCVAAVGVMLAQTRGIKVTQEALIAKIGAPVTIGVLASWLNEADVAGPEKWHGGFISTNGFAVLRRLENWGAVLREGTPLGHLVLVERVDEQSLVCIKDPFDGTSYKMHNKEFLAHWGGEVVLRWKF